MADSASGRSSSVRANLIARADEILGAFDLDHTHLTLSSIGRRTSLPKTTVHRVVNMMVELDWLHFEGGRYSVGARLFGVGSLSPIRSELREIALPYLTDLYRVTGGTVHLAVHEQGSALCVEKISGHDRPAMRSRVGGFMPLDYTGVGKALLAFGSDEMVTSTMSRLDSSRRAPLARDLDRVRLERLAFDRGRDGAVEPRCVAAPVFVPGRPSAIAAISVSLPAKPISVAALGSNLTLVAAAIGRSLGRS